jgi:hypothetical protein
MRFTVFFLFLSSFAIAAQLRIVNAAESEIVDIHTAIGKATRLKFDGRLIDVGLGDQDAFKVEYVGKDSLSIKPLLSKVETNMYVITQYDEFNFTLRSGSSKKVDYRVLVKRRRNQNSLNTFGRQKQPVLLSREVKRKLQSQGVLLEVSSVQWPESKSSFLVNAKINLIDLTKSFKLRSDNFSLFQEGRKLPIFNTYISNYVLSKEDRHSTLTLILPYSQIKKGVPLEFRSVLSGALPASVNLPFNAM